MPRFDQSFTGICEQNHQDTQLLKQRYLEPKAKRPSKPKDKKQPETISSSVHVVSEMQMKCTEEDLETFLQQQKFLKRPSDEHEQSGGGGGGAGGGGSDNFEPPVKLQCTTQQHGSQDQEGLTKFSVQIVQQLEFTSAANSQPQQISTNVTVKAHTNASIKSDVSSPKPPSSQQQQQTQQATGGGGPGGGTNLNGSKGGVPDVGSLIDCVKQEPISDFADLEECAAAVEKDAAANGAMSFGNITDLIGDDTNDELFTSSAFKALIKDIANLNEFNFDFDDKQDDLKLDDGGKDLKLNSLVNSLSMEGKPAATANLCNPSGFAPPTASRIPPYLNTDFVKTELSPAAHTLKQMAEQHQHQKQMGLSFTPTSRPPPNARSPFPDFPTLNEYGKSPNSTNAFHSAGAGVLGPEIIKQEMSPFGAGGGDYDMKRKNTSGMYKQQQQPNQQQQYSPYGSPNPGSHGSPGYLPNRNNASGPNSGGANSSSGNYGAGATPPRPPSVTGSAGTTTLHINQAQSIHISQPNPGHNIQVSAGQHLHLSGDLKGNVSIAAHQGMHFQQQGQQSHHHGGSKASAPPNSNTHGAQTNEVGPMNIPQQQPPPPPNNGGSMMNDPLHNMMGGMNGIGGPHHTITQQQMSDSYSMSQSQTINFTQQSLRQRGSASGMPPNMAMANQMVAPMTANSIRSMSPIEQQKLMQQQQQQQQMLRAQQQQVAMQQQQQHIVRPPPPEYKASAGLVQNMGPRYTTGAAPQPGGPMTGNLMRRMQPTGGGPMMRPSHNMYMMQQQQPQQAPQTHVPIRGMYLRQPAASAMDIPAAGNPGGMPQHGSPEWRHLMMQQQHQQQGNNFSNQLRPSFQQQHHNASKPFSMNPVHMAMPSHLRPSLQAANNSMVGQMGQMPQMLNQQNVGSMTQMNQQQMMMQQQQQLAVQGNSQMSMSNVQVQQTQSLSISNHSMHPSAGGQSHPNLANQQQQQMVAPMSNNQSQMVNQNNDFLDILGIQADSALSEQELLTFASDSGFSLNDITF